MILPPEKAPGHPDRDVDCEDAMRPAFQNLINQAEAAGWTAEEIESALLALANDNIMHAVMALDTGQDRDAPESYACASEDHRQGEAGGTLDDQALKRHYA